MHFSCQHQTRSCCLISTVISLSRNGLRSRSIATKNATTTIRRVALAVPPLYTLDPLRGRLCTPRSLQKGQGFHLRRHGPRFKTSPCLSAILASLPTVESHNTVEMSTVCQPANPSCGVHKALRRHRLIHVAENTRPSQRRPIWKRACIFPV